MHIQKMMHWVTTQGNLKHLSFVGFQIQNRHCGVFFKGRLISNILTFW